MTPSSSSLIINTIYGNEKTLEEILSIFHLLHSLSSSSFGLAGKYKILKAKSEVETATITSLSPRIFSLIRLNHPLARVALQLFTAHTQKFGDGGHFIMITATKLITLALQSPFHIHHIQKVYSSCLEWCEEWLTAPEFPCRIKLDWGEINSLLPLVQSIIRPKGLISTCTKEIVHLSTLIIKAFIVSFSVSTIRGVGTIEHGVSILPLVGAPLSTSQLIPGILVDTPIDAPLPLSNQTIVIFQQALLSPSQIISKMGDVDDEREYADNIYFTHLVELFQKYHITIVASQRTISPSLQRLLKQANIHTWERLSLRHCTSVQQVANIQAPVPLLAGGFPPTDLSPFLGIIMRIEKFTTPSGRHFIHASCNKNINLSTLMLCHDIEAGCEELEVTARNCLSILSHAVLSPYALTGAGSTECHLIHRLKEKKLLLPSLSKKVVQFFIRALRSVVESFEKEKTTPGPRHYPPFVAELLKKNGGGGLAGYDPKRKDVFFLDLDAPAVLDLLAMKTEALRTAVNICTIIIRVQSIIFQ